MWEVKVVGISEHPILRFFSLEIKFLELDFLISNSLTSVSSPRFLYLSFFITVSKSQFINLNFLISISKSQFLKISFLLSIY